MAKIPETFYIGDRKDLNTEDLLEIIEKMYFDLAVAINSKPDIYERSTDGQTSDTVLANGDININTSTGKVEMLTSHLTTTAVTWTQLS